MFAVRLMLILSLYIFYKIIFLLIKKLVRIYLYSYLACKEINRSYKKKEKEKCERFIFFKRSLDFNTVNFKEVEFGSAFLKEVPPRDSKEFQEL